MSTKRAPSEASAERHAGGVHTLEGHAIEVRQREGKEELWIDGERRKFFVTADGYTLHADAYAPPQKTLLDAVKHYLSKKPDVGHEH